MISYLLEKFSVPTETRWTPAHLSLCLRVVMFTCSCTSKSVLAHMSTSSQPPTLIKTVAVPVSHLVPHKGGALRNWAGFTRVLLTWTNQMPGHSSGVSAAGGFYSEWEWNVTGGTCFRNENGCDCVCVIFDQCVFTCAGKWQTPGEGKSWNMTSHYCLR